MLIKLLAPITLRQWGHPREITSNVLLRWAIGCWWGPRGCVKIPKATPFLSVTNKLSTDPVSKFKAEFARKQVWRAFIKSLWVSGDQTSLSVWAFWVYTETGQVPHNPESKCSSTLRFLKILSIVFIGRGWFCIGLILSGPMTLVPSDMIRPRYLTDCWQSWAFSLEDM